MDDARFVEVNGIRTRYFEAGAGEPLILVHGGNFGGHWNAEDWEHNIEGLAASFHVFALDKIGCGHTDNPPSDADYLMRATVDHVHGFIRELGLGPVHIAGHSRGGYTVTRLALEHPEVVRTLIIVDSSSLMTPPNPNNVVWEEEAARIADPREGFRYLITVNSYDGAHITDRYLDGILEMQALPKTAEARAKWYGGLNEVFKRDLVARQVETHEWIRSGGLACPTLVIWGYNDPSATMERCGIPCMNLILPSVARSEMHILNHAGHSSFREQPEAFNAAVLDFIGRTRS